VIYEGGKERERTQNYVNQVGLKRRGERSGSGRGPLEAKGTLT